MGVGDDETNAVQARRLSAQQELAPERPELDLADIEVDHLTHPALVNGVGDHDRLETTRPWSRTLTCFASSHRYGWEPSGPPTATVTPLLAT